MRCIDGVDGLIISLLPRGHPAARGIKRFLRSIEFPLAQVRLLLRGGVRIAQVQYVLFGVFCVMTRLLQFAMCDTGAILALAECVALISHRGLCLRHACHAQHGSQYQ